MLIALAGRPGAGKSTIARLLAQTLGATHLRIDTIEQTLRASGMLKADVGPAGYMIGYAMAAENLRNGQTVIADSVNPLQITRDAWRKVADRAHCPLVEVEITCSDRHEHRRRIETRHNDIEGLVQPTWQQVIGRDFHPWDKPPISIDTAGRAAEDCVSDIVSRLPR